MSVFRGASGSDPDVDIQSTSSQASEDPFAAIWEHYSVKYQPVYAIKAKNQFSSARVLGKELPALTCSLSYTVGHQSRYTTAVVKPTDPRSSFIRKVKVFPDKQEVRVYGKRWALWGWGHFQAQLDWDWRSGRRLPQIQYAITTKWERDAQDLTSKVKVPSVPSLIQLRPYWNLKKHFPSVQGRVGSGGVQQKVDQAYCHCKIPRMELVLTAGKSTNWRSAWPPHKWFGSSDRARRRKLAWEESLDSDSRKDQFVRSLSDADREEYFKTHLV